MKGTPANGPPCDLNKACSVGESLGLMVPSTRRPWTGSVALHSHPWRREARFHVIISPQLFGANSRCQLLPGGCVESSCCQMFSRGADPCQVERRVSSMEGVHYSSTDGGVLFVAPSANSLPSSTSKRVWRAMWRFGDPKPPRDNGRLA